MNFISKIKGLPIKLRGKPGVNNGKLRKKTIIIIAIVIIAVLICIFAIKKLSGNETAKILNEKTVTKSDIQVSISGTATVEANAQYDVTALVQGEVIADYFEEGQEVTKGDVLYQIDTTDAQNSVDKAKLSLEKAQDSYNSSVNDAKKLNVSASNSGTITSMYVSVGDNVSTNTKICDIIDNTKLKLTIPFISEDANNIYMGQYASVTVSSSGQNINGTVTHVGTGDVVNSYGAIIRYIEITVSNPGSLKSGEEVVAVIGAYACQDSGTLEYISSESVYAETSGTVSKLNKTLGYHVNKGDTIATLTSESLSDSIKSSSLSLKESQLSLQNTEDMLDDYTITAPISGTVIQKTTKVGDTMDNSNSTTVMCVIADYSKTTIELNIDELDLADVSVGQTVKIVADAFPDKTYTGYVDYISKVGTASMGATSYPVTIVITDPDDLIVGMNVSAEIITQSAENVMVVPQSAVQRGNIVFVKKDNLTSDSEKVDDQEAQRLDIPDGYAAVRVETGLTDGDFVEIKSGLSENDSIAYYTVALSGDSSGKSSEQGAMGGMPGGGMQGVMPGGMPSGGSPGVGGGPSGGTSRNNRSGGGGF